MRVFIAWAEERSRQYAEAFRNWLTQVVQAAEPFISTEIEKGARWSEEIKGALNASKIGVLVVTPENAANTWLHFEAGALSGHLEKQRVCVLLFGMKPANLSGPLTQFQSAQFEKGDVLKLVRTINSCLEKPLTDDALKTAFEKWWPDLETTVVKVGHAGPATPAQPKRSDREILEELLETVRALSSRVPPRRRTIETNTAAAETAIEYVEKILKRPLSGGVPELVAEALLVLDLGEDDLSESERTEARAAFQRFSRYFPRAS